jgi:AcrR family transcriptional regulator
MPTPKGRPRGGAPAKDRELRERGQRTLAKLHAAGVEVFQRLGYQAARVDDIVKTAKTSHGTFYLYFSNKEDLFRTLVLDVAAEMQILADTLGPITDDPAGWAELRDWIARFSELYLRHRAVIQTWTEADSGDNELGRMGTDLLGGFTRTLVERIAENAGRGVNPDIAALALVAMVERFNYYYLVLGQIDAAPDEMLDTLATVAHRGLFGGGVPRRPARARSVPRG